MLKDAIPLIVRDRVRRARHRLRWGRTGFDVPAPQRVKLEVIRRYGQQGGLWIETGTFLGTTTKQLAKIADAVYTIEPSPELAAQARRRLARHANITVLEGLSEDLLPGLLDGRDGSVSFWLDGHGSGGPTFLGPLLTPIRQELQSIEDHLAQFDQVAVLVDDFRGFGASSDVDGDYPSRSFLVDWADRNGLAWTVEHDIFAAWRA
jgi:hypothetical protein